MLDSLNFGNVPSVDTNAVGEYQLEIRRATSFGPGMLDPRDRLVQSATLIAPAGVELFDGKTFTLSDGLHTVVFEFENQAIGDGVADGHVAVPFDTTDSAVVIAERIRDAVNSPEAQGQLKIRAALSDGVVAGAGTTTNRVDLIGNAMVVPEEAPNGIETLDLDPNRFGTPNTNRDQGQVILHSNRILNAVQYGIVVEDGLRDLPEYRFFDLDDVVKHAQFTHGDYVPHSGPVRNLSEINQDALAPGVTISNNVLAFNGEGGIHFSGDPNGYMLVAPVAHPDEGEVNEAVPYKYFQITDLNGLTVRFQFEPGPAFRFDGTGTVPPNIDIVPVPYQPTMPLCLATHGIQDCTNRYHPLARDVADALMHAIDSSNLDVTLLRGTGDEIFIEGAAQIVGLNPTSWIESYVTEVQRGGVPYGRIINNTIVGLGGLLESNNLYNEFDYQDVGILIEDNADPTLLNNLIVNFEEGIATDLSSTSVILGGTLFQGNVVNTRNIDQGDFSLVVASTAPMFVDRERGNFYPAAGSRAIDSALDSLEDRPGFLTIRDPLEISPSPILAPAFDVLGQLRMDDPRVEPPSGVGQNVFKDRGAIDRVDFSGPRSQLVQPQDNDTAGSDQNPQLDRVRLDNANLNAFVLQLTDIGEAGTATGTGIDDDLVTSDSVVVLRDGVPLVPDVDYRFDYLTTTGQILLSPQAGVWLTGYTYEIRLVNQDRFLIAPPSADQIADGEVLQVTDERGRTTLFEFESGYTLEVPLPLGLLVPPGTSGLSAVADRDLFTLSNGVRLVTFEFDSNNQISSGRIRVPFTASDTPQQVADAIVAAIELADLGLAPQNLGDGQVHIGGPFNTLLDVSLSSLVPLGTAAAVFDGDNFSIQNSQRLVTFEFDDDGDVSLGNIAIAFTNSDTQQQLADAVAEAIRGTTLGLDAQHVGDGRVHLGGTPDVVVRVVNSTLSVVGQPGLQTNPGGRQLVPIVYVPSPDLQTADVSQLIQDAIESSALVDVTTFVDESGQLVVQGAADVQAQAFPPQFVPGIRDLAGNSLQTNLDEPPFDVQYYIELPAPLDFGDTPDGPYATLLASDGPRHVLVPNIYLGAGVDAELDAHTDSEANGDLLDDGVQFGGPITPRGWVTVSITASTNGLVDAWIDYDANGVFHRTQERILASVPVRRGSNSFVVTVPADATLGTTFARFRLSTAGGLSPTGRADNGEVEDYQVEIVSIAPPIAVDDDVRTG